MPLGFGTTEVLPALGKLGKYEAAIHSFDRAIEFDPDNSIFWHNQGITLSARGRYEQAIANFNRAIEINPDSKLD